MKLVGEFRSFDPARVQALAERWRTVCEQTAKEMEGTVEVNFTKTFDAARISLDAPIARLALEVLR